MMRQTGRVDEMDAGANRRSRRQVRYFSNRTTRFNSMRGHSVSGVIATLALVALCLVGCSAGQKQEQTTRNILSIPKSTTTAATTSVIVAITNATNQTSESNNHDRKNSSSIISPTTTTTSTTTTTTTTASSNAGKQQQVSASRSTSNPQIIATNATSQNKRQTVHRVVSKVDSKKLDEKRHSASQRSDNFTSKNNNGRDPIDQMSTSQSVSFADPLSTDGNSNSNNFKEIKGANRWTHFGARLKPLVKQIPSSPLDNNNAAANPKSLAATVSYGPNNHHNSQQHQRVAASRNAATIIAPSNGIDTDEDDDSDDDQDSEALLYKLMQQQSFLMSPNWQESGGNLQPAKMDSTMRASGRTQQVAGSIQEQNQQQQPSVANTRRVIKLLKSYSHIHQVDDSDDQIRGSYTRIPNRRPANKQWQQQVGRQSGRENYGNNENRSPTRKQEPQTGSAKPMQHIFVSSQPVNQQASHNIAQQGRYPSGQAVSSESQARQPDSDDMSSSGGFSPSSDGDNSGQEGRNGEEESAGSAAQEEDEFECPNNGIFADEASGCQAYHVCQAGAQVQEKFQCPLGTLFNNIILTCDFAHNVQCGGKGRQTTTTLKPISASLQKESIYRGQQPVPTRDNLQFQQQPRASTQVGQASYARAQQPRPQQQARRPPVQQGPVQLVVGSQYNKHQLPKQPVQAQAVSAYPISQPLANNEVDDDSDGEPVSPLIPATLPPRPASIILPYKQPPSIEPSNNRRPGTNYQSSHKSQSFKQVMHSTYKPNQLNNYDATSATMTFVERDEPASTSPTTTTSLGANSGVQEPERPTTSLSSNDESQKSSFDLIINHVAPLRQNPQVGHNLQDQFGGDPSRSYEINKKQTVASKQKQLQDPVGLNTASTDKRKEAKVSENVNKPPKNKNFVQQSASSSAVKQQAVSLKRNVDISRQPKQPQRAPQQQPPVNPSKPGRKAGSKENYGLEQKADLLTQKNPPLATSQRGTLVDLTNDKQSQGISSEALNDGLLLIVRHGSGSNPIQVGINGANSYGRDRATSSDQYTSQHQQTPSRVANTEKKTPAVGQAYAIDPTLVRPDSPIDAQLFPHVQRTLASQANQQKSSHQSEAQRALFTSAS